MGFINGIAHGILIKAIDKSGILNNDVMAYRKGRSVEDIATAIILMLEESSETGDPVALIMEDKGKIFHRVTYELQAASISASGIPKQG